MGRVVRRVPYGVIIVFRAPQGLGVGSGNAKTPICLNATFGSVSFTSPVIIVVSTSTHLLSKPFFAFFPSPSAGPGKSSSFTVQIPLPLATFLCMSSQLRPWLRYGAPPVITLARKTIDLGDPAGPTQRMTQVHWSSSGSRRTRSRSGWIPRRIL